jgi:hypothetical protein
MLCQDIIDPLRVASAATFGAMVSVAEFVRKVMEDHRLSRQELGEAMGYSGTSARQTVYKMLKGEHGLQGWRLRLLTERYAVDPSIVLDLDLKLRAGASPIREKDNKMREDFEDLIPLITFVYSDGSASRRVVGNKLRPPSLRDVRDPYAIYMPDNSMLPRYRRGWLLWINPGKPVSDGRDALVFPLDGPPIVRELVREPDDTLVAKPLNGGPKYREDQIEAMHLVVASDQEG